jgi:hypothetical protein
MKRMTCFFILATLLLLASSVSAATPLEADYDLSGRAVSGGGFASDESGGYILGGTAGQPDADVLTGAGYTLAGGFWGGGLAECRVYLPLILKGH